MAAKPPALMLAPETPYPAMGGGALRTAALAEYLAARYRLDVVAFRQPGEHRPETTRLGDMAHLIGTIDLPEHRRNALSRGVRNLDRLRRGAPPLVDRFGGFEAEIARRIAEKRYCVGIVEHFWCASYGRLLRGCCERVVLDLHNVESALHAGLAECERWPLNAILQRFGKACRRMEERWLPEFGLLLAASEADAARIRPVASESPVAVYPNTIPFRPPPARRELERIAFSGNLEYLPNIHAVRFFARDIWPRLRARHAGLEWLLIGKHPEAVRRYVQGDPRIVLTGPVEDAIAELAGVKAAVVPVLAGSGTRVKILESWAAATPVVSTRIGAEGLGAVPDEHLVIADGPAEFAAAVSALLESGVRRQRIGQAGRRLYEREFTWDAGWRRLESLGL